MTKRNRMEMLGKPIYNLMPYLFPEKIERVIMRSIMSDSVLQAGARYLMHYIKENASKANEDGKFYVSDLISDNPDAFTDLAMARVLVLTEALLEEHGEQLPETSLTLLLEIVDAVITVTTVRGAVAADELGTLIEMMSSVEKSQPAAGDQGDMTEELREAMGEDMWKEFVDSLSVPNNKNEEEE